VIHLDRAIADLEQLLRRVIGEDIDLRIEHGSGVPPVKADPGQIGQVVMNLVVNARDAMEHGGRLAIRTAARDFDDASARAAGVRPGRYAVMEIEDTGSGMDEETLARAFEPFFTTKEPGRGTGLGLSTVYGIVTQSQGCILVDTTPGRGTKFTVALPAAAEPAAATAIAADEDGLQRGVREQVLVAEDEPAIRELVIKVLTGMGYRVVVAANGGEALDAARRHGGPIDLLIADVVMPDLSGPQLAERLARQHPKMRVLFLSGYSDHPAVHDRRLRKEAAFLQKPFTLSALAEKVRLVLDTPGRAA
jgi:CheY-like chemotaxis protein